MIYKIFILSIIVLMIYYIDKIKNWSYLKRFKYPIIVFLIYSIMYVSTLNFHSVSVYKDDRNLVFYDDSILIKNRNIKIENIEKIGKYSRYIIIVFEKNNEKYVLMYLDSTYFEIFKKSEDISYYENFKEDLMNYKIFKLKYTVGDKYGNK